MLEDGECKIRIAVDEGDMKRGDVGSGFGGFEESAARGVGFEVEFDWVKEDGFGHSASGGERVFCPVTDLGIVAGRWGIGVL